MTPEKWHLALNHLVFLLPLAALIPLLIGARCKSRPAMLSGVLIALLGSGMTGVVMGTGEEAYERYEEGAVAAYLDAGAEDALHNHEEMAHTWSKVMYVLLGVSALGLLIGWIKPKWLPAASQIVAFLCLASGIAGIAIADTGGEIRRPDFRDPAAQTSSSSGQSYESHEHDDDDHDHD